MAMDKAALIAEIRVAAKEEMYDVWQTDTNELADFDPLAKILAEQIAGPVIQHILDNAETDPSAETIT